MGTNGTAARKAAEAMRDAIAERDLRQGEEARAAEEEADIEMQHYWERHGDVRPRGAQGLQEGFCGLGDYPWELMDLILVQALPEMRIEVVRALDFGNAQRYRDIMANVVCAELGKHGQPPF